jgi:hypothetical protein
VGTKVLDPLRACVMVADCYDPSSVGTLTCIKSLAMMFESIVPRIRTIHNSRLFLLILVRMIRTSCINKSPNQISLIIKFKSLKLTLSQNHLRNEGFITSRSIGGFSRL